MMAFVTSVRHPRNCNSYDRISELLGYTLQSVTAQTDDRYIVIVVCNQLPTCRSDGPVHFVTVDFPAPSPLRRPGTGMQAIRIDKGAKYLVGLMYARRFQPDHVMFFDADDLVSRRLVRFVHDQSADNSWYLGLGYQYQCGSSTVRLLTDFHRHCGTSHIYRNDALEVPVELDVQSNLETILSVADRRYLLNVLGSHRVAIEHYRRRGHPFLQVPFPAAVWVLGTGENHSGRSAAAGNLPVDEDLVAEFRIPRRASQDPV